MVSQNAVLVQLYKDTQFIIKGEEKFLKYIVCPSSELLWWRHWTKLWHLLKKTKEIRVPQLKFNLLLLPQAAEGGMGRPSGQCTPHLHHTLAAREAHRRHDQEPGRGQHSGHGEARLSTARQWLCETDLSAEACLSAGLPELPRSRLD